MTFTPKTHDWLGQAGAVLAAAAAQTLRSAQSFCVAWPVQQAAGNCWSIFLSTMTVIWRALICLSAWYWALCDAHRPRHRPMHPLWLQPKKATHVCWHVQGLASLSSPLHGCGTGAMFLEHVIHKFDSSPIGLSPVCSCRRCSVWWSSCDLWWTGIYALGRQAQVRHWLGLRCCPAKRIQQHCALTGTS